jgi:phenylpropionate dioxygenase-like ring-hydroxylating dioxygenase large terminal subunit
MMENVLRNTWYVAGWAEELPAGALLARRLLDEPVVLMRGSDGQPTALADRCPHRFAPLSMGRLVDDGQRIECPYHGLRFDTGTGRCVLNPQGDGSIPKAAVVRAYPVVERHSLLWIWMGDADKADPATIPVFDHLDPQRSAVGWGYMLVAGHYELENDNILDLSHIEFLHPLFSSEAVRRGQIECRQEGQTVWSQRMMRNDNDVPAFLREAFGVPTGPIDRWLDVRWDAPANMALWAGGCAAGGDTGRAVVSAQAHCFTPETAGTTHYFYAITFPRALGPMADQLARDNVQALRAPFEFEDKPIIEAVQRNMAGAELWSLKPVLLPGDAAAVRARRVLQGLIAAEQAARSPISPT